MNTIVCLKHGTKYPAKYVNNLLHGVEKHTTIPFEFHCFTEENKGLDSSITIHGLPHKLPGPGWWQKLYMFSKEAELEGRVLYVDLDTLVTGNIDHIVQHNEGFVVLEDFYKKLFPNVKHYDVGSGILSWTVGDHVPLWEEFIKNPADVVRKWHPHGDQKWIQANQFPRLYWQDLYPNHFVSFKVHCKKGLPDNARLVSFHGSPSIPGAIKQGRVWIKEYWK